MFERFKGKENLRYLEIGVFEGRSAIWMLGNVLTHPTARLTAVDIFFGDLEKKFRENLKRSGSQNKVNILKGTSQERLRQLPLDSFDMIYIDCGENKLGISQKNFTLQKSVGVYFLSND